MLNTLRRTASSPAIIFSLIANNAFFSGDLVLDYTRRRQAGSRPPTMTTLFLFLFLVLVDRCSRWSMVCGIL
uniref:GM08676p n=1 Tax=Drosophila melanogaster TaxID=7227 RepID=Q95S55_DROME|nr:GM08676p [Drosophila melanogaster]